MAGAQSQHRLGIALVVIAAVAFSTAPFFTRLLPYDSWTILFWRGLFGGGLITVMMVLLQGRAGLRELLGMSTSGWLVTIYSTLGMMAFIPSLQLTSVSNVAIIVGNARMGSDISGIALACFMALAIAAMTVTVRRHKETSMVAAAAISNLLVCVVSIPFAHGITGITRFDLFILSMFGFFQVALGLTLFFLGSRLLPSGQAALISTLETPLMPFWIWLAFAEVPGSRVVLGGALVMGAVIADIIGGNREQKPLT